jgi:hypothetical protein
MCQKDPGNEEFNTKHSNKIIMPENQIKTEEKHIMVYYMDKDEFEVKR